MVAIRERSADQVVAIVQRNCDDAVFARIVELVERCFLDGSHRSRHKNILISRESALFTGQGQDDGDLLALLQGKHVDDWTATRSARAGGHFPHLEPVKPAPVGKAQNVIMSIGDKQLVNPIVFLGGSRLFAAAAAFLRPVFR